MKISENKKELYFFDSSQVGSYKTFKNIFVDFFNHLYTENRDIIFLCIGTDKCTGDSLGPLVGSNIFTREYTGVYVYGTLKHPIHAKNLSNTIQNINSNHFNPFIIAIDASIGKEDYVGYVCIDEGPLFPGAALKKDLPDVGHISITGTVTSNKSKHNNALQMTRLYTVINIAKVIAGGINLALEELNL